MSEDLIDRAVSCEGDHLLDHDLRGKCQGDLYVRVQEHFLCVECAKAVAKLRGITSGNAG